MSKPKKKRKAKKRKADNALAVIVFITAILNLIQAVYDLISKLFK